MGIGDYRFALEFKEEMARLVKEEVERQRPRYQMATVVSIDRNTRRCVVNFPGDSTNATVTMGATQPSSVGQVVRVEGLAGDRYISDVMGPPYEFLDERLVALESDPSATANFALNGNFESGRDNWNDFWSAGSGTHNFTIESAPGLPYSGNNAAKINLVGNDTNYVTLQQNVQYVNPGEVIMISWREKATSAGAVYETELGASFGPDADNANFFGTGAVGLTGSSAVTVATTNYVLRRTSVVVPSGKNFVRFYVRARVKTGQTGPANGGVIVDDFRMQRVILQGNPTDPVIFGGTTQFTGQTWAWNGIIFPTVGDTLKGAGWQNLMQSIRMQASALIGGGVRTVTSTGVGWSNRFIGICAGKAASGAPAGYFDIDFPANGTVITGVGGAPNKTVAGSLIPLAGWEALYYIPPYGDVSTFKPENLRVVGFVGDYVVPNEWIMLGLRSSDSGMVTWFDGREQDYWRFPTLSNGWVYYNTASFSAAGYKRDNGIVYLRGLIKNGTLSSTVFILPVGYRPENSDLYSGITTGSTSSGASTGTAHTHTISYPATRIDVGIDGVVNINSPLASNGYVSLASISFPASPT